MNGERRAPTPRILLFRGDRSGSKTRLTTADLNLRIYKNGGGGTSVENCFLQYFNSHQKIKAIKLVLSNNRLLMRKRKRKEKSISDLTCILFSWKGFIYSTWDFKMIICSHYWSRTKLLNLFQKWFYSSSWTKILIGLICH